MINSSDQVSYEQSPLWRRTLGEVPGDCWAAQRAALRAAYQQFRSVVAPLANEIVLSMPMFTDHSISHIDALWDTASIVCGDDFPLNPAEAFVLGGAFLMHDLGMGLCAYPGGVDQVIADPAYPGLLVIATERLQNLEPAADPAAAAAVAQKQALVELLRRRHAEQAQQLLRTPFTGPDGSDNYLLADLSLRLDYGSMIGEIAESHWWDVGRLRELDRVQGSRPDHPPAWTVDPLKIACILRLADAAHIDNRRAPSYVHAFRRPSGVAEDHWVFQERLTRPQLDDDRLVYTSTRRFAGVEAPAWWLAYETIQMIDGELRRVDALCADLKRPRFRARSVAGADAPDRLAGYLQTDRWRPIDARIRVTDVDKVVGNLGGEKLYGKRPDVALRELVANASDATLARSAREGAPPGTVTIMLTMEGGSWWLTVADQGIGMQPDTMVSALTDFGFSRWRSADTLTEYPELSGFQPTGRFGIGFFSIFMVADEVTVRSLALEEAARDTYVLEFANGVSVRPLLRAAERSEWLRQPGTVIRARLRVDPRSSNGLFRNSSRRLTHTEYLHAMVLPMCALARVHIDVQGPDDPVPIRLVNANDWVAISDSELFERVYHRPDDTYGHRLGLEVYRQRFLERAEEIHDEQGRVIGRAMMTSVWEGTSGAGWWGGCQSHIYVGGLKSDILRETMGVFVGSPLTADRLRSFPDANPDQLTRWAESQADRVSRSSRMGSAQRQIIGDLGRALGAVAPQLPCALSNGRALDVAALRRWLGGRSCVLLVDDRFYVHYRPDDTPWFISYSGGELRFPEDCLVVSFYSEWMYPEEVLPRPKDERFADTETQGLKWNARSWWYDTGNFGSVGIVVRTIAEAWDLDVAELLDLVEPMHLDEDGDDRCPVPLVGGGVERVEMVRLQRPGVVSEQATAAVGG
ncbi:ATP-binding protein [Micromonospora sp. NPDC047620]|uniref:HD domain-containing protein n=1 Tax=Micromonospora sp. NPDC047620 TaxID=3364251 RepID=UPI0037223FD7